MIDPAQTHTRPIIACGARSTTTHRVTGGIVDNPEQRGSGPAHRAVPVRTASACPYAQPLTRGQVSGAAVLCSVLSRPQSLPVGYIMHGPSRKASGIENLHELAFPGDSFEIRGSGDGTRHSPEMGTEPEQCTHFVHFFLKMYPKWPLLHYSVGPQISAPQPSCSCFHRVTGD